HDPLCADLTRVHGRVVLARASRRLGADAEHRVVRGDPRKLLERSCPVDRDGWPGAGCRIPATVADPLIKEFRYAVLAGLASIPPIPGPSTPPSSAPAATCSNSAVTGKLTYCGSPQTRRSGPPTTSASAASARTRPSRRSPAA